jgi:hypothetical protein
VIELEVAALFLAGCSIRFAFREHVPHMTCAHGGRSAYLYHSEVINIGSCPRRIVLSLQLPHISKANNSSLAFALLPLPRPAIVRSPFIDLLLFGLGWLGGHGQVARGCRAKREGE